MISRVKLFKVSILFLVLILVYYSRQFEINELRSQTIRQLQQINSIITPTPSEEITYRSSVNSNLKYIIYKTSEDLILKKITDNQTSSKIIFSVPFSSPDFMASISPNERYLALMKIVNKDQDSIYSLQSPTMNGFSHYFDLIDLTTDKKVSLHLTSNKFGSAHITEIGFISDDRIFIGLENDDIFEYNITQKTYNQIYKSDRKPFSDDNFCAGMHLISSSPNLNNLLVSARCFEGTTFYNLSLSNNKLTKLGGGYGPGTPIALKYDSNNSIVMFVDNYDQKINEFVNKYYLVDLLGNKIKDITAPKKENSTSEIMVKNNTAYLNDLNGNQQVIGTNVIKIYPLYP